MLLASPLIALAADEVQVRSQRARTQEALDNVGCIFRGAVAYYEAEHNSRTGQIVPRHFPRAIGPSPSLATLASAKGRRLQPWPGTWDAASWQALSFTVGDPHRYVYQFDSQYRRDVHDPSWNQPRGLPNAFTARAHGDLDGDGAFSTFERAAAGDAIASIVSGPLHVEHELE